MKSDVVTPVGIEQSLEELRRRNAAESRARGESPSAISHPASCIADHVFVCNSAKGHNFGLIEGAPKATEFFSVEQLEASGLVGLYRSRKSEGADL